MKQRIVILPGNNSGHLAKRISEICGYELGDIKWREFSDGEYKPVIKTNVRKADVYIINSTNSPDRNLTEVMLIEDAAMRASAKSITFVCPYFGGERQERKDEARTCITAAVNAKRINDSKISKFMVMDLHADAIQGFFDMPVDHVFASTLFLPDLQAKGVENVVFASPDAGGLKRVEKYGNHFGCPIAVFFKGRLSSEPNAVKKMVFLGNVKGKHVVFIDDMFDSLGTIQSADELLVKEGVMAITAYATHPVFSHQAYDRMKTMSHINFVVTDTIPIPQRFLDLKNLRVISVADLFAKVIERDVEGESISELYVFKDGYIPNVFEERSVFTDLFF
ncbi:MAG: ribose-phosphate diphosphokinase [Candidatus Absconditicoccaceae bacterium]